MSHLEKGSETTSVLSSAPNKSAIIIAVLTAGFAAAASCTLTDADKRGTCPDPCAAQANGGGGGGAAAGGDGGMNTGSGAGGDGGMETGGGGYGGDGGSGGGCVETGTTCDNGLLGECYAEGVYECVDNMDECNAPVVAAGTESCNGKDDDCNDITDDLGTCFPSVIFAQISGGPCIEVGTVTNFMTFDDGESTPSGFCLQGPGTLATTPGDGEHTWIWFGDVNAGNTVIQFDCVNAYPFAQIKCSENATVPPRSQMIDDYNSAEPSQVITVTKNGNACSIAPAGAAVTCTNPSRFIDMAYTY